MGQSYLLGCPDGGEEQLLKAVQRVDAGMCKIRDAGKVRARDRIAVLAALLSIWLMSLTLSVLPIGTAYAVWAGIGAAGTAVIGMMFFDEPTNLARISCIGLVIVGIVGLVVLALLCVYCTYGRAPSNSKRDGDLIADPLRS